MHACMPTCGCSRRHACAWACMHLGLVLKLISSCMIMSTCVHGEMTVSLHQQEQRNPSRVRLHVHRPSVRSRISHYSRCRCCRCCCFPVASPLLLHLGLLATLRVPPLLVRRAALMRMMLLRRMVRRPFRCTVERAIAHSAVILRPTRGDGRGDHTARRDE